MHVVKTVDLASLLSQRERCRVVGRMCVLLYHRAVWIGSRHLVCITISFESSGQGGQAEKGSVVVFVPFILALVHPFWVCYTFRCNALLEVCDYNRRSSPGITQEGVPTHLVFFFIFPFCSALILRCLPWNSIARRCQRSFSSSQAKSKVLTSIYFSFFRPLLYCKVASERFSHWESNSGPRRS